MLSLLCAMSPSFSVAAVGTGGLGERADGLQRSQRGSGGCRSAQMTDSAAESSSAEPCVTVTVCHVSSSSAPPPPPRLPHALLLTVGLPIRVLHLLSNPVHAHFGMNAAGTDTAVTLKALFAAMTVAGIRQGHVISEASPIITHPAWCAAVVDGADCRPVVNASVSAAIGSGALVLVAYGAQVRRCFTAERLRSLGVRRGRERRVGGLTVYDVVRSDDGCGLMVVECEHPSAHTDHQQVYSAVALTEQLCSGASDGPAERAIADIRREADEVAAHEELQDPKDEQGEGKEERELEEQEGEEGAEGR